MNASAVIASQTPAEPATTAETATQVVPVQSVISKPPVSTVAAPKPAAKKALPAKTAAKPTPVSSKVIAKVGVAQKPATKTAAVKKPVVKAPVVKPTAAKKAVVVVSKAPTKPSPVVTKAPAVKVPVAKKATASKTTVPVKVTVKPAVKKQAIVKSEPTAMPKTKLVRDSFTMPQKDFALIAILKDRALGFKRPTKKSELLRAGLHALALLNLTALRTALETLTPLKTGRPKKETR